MFFIPELTLTVDADGSYSLQATTSVPSPAHQAGLARIGVPAGSHAPGDAVCVTLPIITGGAQGMAIVGTVKHRIPGLKLKPGGVVHAFVTVDDAVSGQGTAIAGAVQAKTQGAGVSFSIDVEESSQISPADCLVVVVITTPKKKADSPTQQLHELGVVDDKQTRLHQNKVATEMKNRGSSIEPDRVNSGPNVTIADCSHTVFINQGS